MNDSKAKVYPWTWGKTFPATDVAFYEAAHERWSAFSEAMWAGTGPQFNEVQQG